MSGDNEPIATKVKQYLVTAYLEISVHDCEAGSNIRALKPAGVEKLAASIADVGFLPSSIVAVVLHPTKPGKYLAIDGWHRINAVKFLLKTNPNGQFKIPAMVYKKTLPRALLLHYAHGTDRLNGCHVRPTCWKCWMESGVGYEDCYEDLSDN